MPTNLLTFAIELRCYLSDWLPSSEGRCVWLRHCTHRDARLALREDRHGRIALSGVYPYGFEPRNSPRITVDPNRDPARIAADVQRRLIGPYLPLLRQALEQQAAYQADAARKQAQREQLAEVLDAAVHDYSGQPRIYWRGPGTSYGTVKVESSVDLELRGLPFDLALAICQAIQTYQEAPLTPEV